MTRFLPVWAALVSFIGSSAAAQSAPIVAEAVIEAPVDSVWWAWTTGEGLRAWLAPHADIDLRIGGTMRTNYDPSGGLGDAGTIENAILSLEPFRMLSIRVSRAPDGVPFPTAIFRMWTVIYLVPRSENQTMIRVVGLGFEEDEESQRMRKFFEQGNRATLAKLHSYFGARDPK